MTQWWLFIAAFWGWYLADCAKLSRQARFLFGSLWGTRRARTQHERLTIAPLLPTGWHGHTDDLPYSFSPDGLSNQPIGSAGRPAPEPDVIRAWRWEEIKEVRARRGRILINGQDFCAKSSFGDAALVEAMARELAPLSPAERARQLQRQLAAWFRPLRIRRLLSSSRGRTAILRDLTCINFLITLSLSVYLMLDGPSHLGREWADRLMRMLPMLGAYYGLLHVATLVLAWRAHRRFLPKKSDQRNSLIVNAALMPPHAMKLRDQIVAARFPVQHPLAWTAAVGHADEQRRLARQVVTDLRWPLPARRLENAELVARVSAWMRQHIEPEIRRTLAAMSLTPEALLAAPARDSQTSCAYCPRCGDQFTKPGAGCPRGIPSQTLK